MVSVIMYISHIRGWHIRHRMSSAHDPPHYSLYFDVCPRHYLKEYYEIVNGSPPSFGILPHRCRWVCFLQKYISTQETKQSYEFQSSERNLQMWWENMDPRVIWTHIFNFKWTRQTLNLRRATLTIVDNVLWYNFLNVSE